MIKIIWGIKKVEVILENVPTKIKNNFF